MTTGYWQGNNRRPLFELRNANMQSTADQVFTKVGEFTNYIPRRIVAVRRTGAAAVTCLGGIYTGAGKTGDALASALTSWLGLSGVGKMVDAALAAIGLTDMHSQSPILSLTTGSSAACTADLFVYGDPVD